MNSTDEGYSLTSSMYVAANHHKRSSKDIYTQALIEIFWLAGMADGIIYIRSIDTSISRYMLRIYITWPKLSIRDLFPIISRLDGWVTK